MTNGERKNAIHCLKVMAEIANCEDCELYGTTGTDHCERDFVRNAIKALEQEPKWIHVSKQLPKTDGMYLVTTTGTHNDVVDIAYYYKDIGFHKASKVLAWMPLPEPYKAESEGT